MPKPISAAQLEANRKNARLGGRRRIRIDHGKWARLAFDGRFNDDIARQLGISVRTLQRRKRDLAAGTGE